MAGLLVPGGIALAVVLAAGVLVLWPERPLANPPLGVAARVDYRVLPPSADIASLERGRSYYGQLCIGCHGARGDGSGEWAYRVTPQPADLTGERIRLRSDAQLASAIAEGLPGTPMKGWRDLLSPTQMGQVVLYVRHLAHMREAT